jgi:hypothetical protein
MELQLRQLPLRPQTRKQSSATVSKDGKNWLLLNASPDLVFQFGALPSGTSVNVTMLPGATLISDGVAGSGMTLFS